MVTDDPGTPGDGHWEVNLAGIYSSTREQKVLQSPYFDVNYGWGESTQLKVEGGWVNGWDANGKNQNGHSDILIGVKYRFLDEDKNGVAISIYPAVEFSHFFSSHNPEIAPAGKQVFLPIEFSKTFGAWALDPEIGYLYGTQASNEIFYGVVMAYEKAKPFEPLAEVHVTSRFNGTGSTTLLNFGLRYTVSPHLNLIGSVGHTVTNTDDSAPELDAYLGLQFEI